MGATAQEIQRLVVANVRKVVPVVQAAIIWG